MMKRQHKKFIAEMKDHGDVMIAYKAAYPSVKATTARVNGYKLLQNATIATEINKTVEKRQKAIEAAKDEQEITGAIEAVKIGIKTKNERVFEYQEEIGIMQDQLKGKIKFTFKVGNAIKHSHGQDGTFMVPVDIQNELRNTIKSYKTEISKMEGDYAPTKVASTDSAGNDVKEQSVDLSKLSTETLKVLLNACE